MYGTDHSKPVNLNEWVLYYSNISANIDDDKYFRNFINSVWNLDGKGFKFRSAKVQLILSSNNVGNT
jgi:hypothetical protein